MNMKKTILLHSKSKKNIDKITGILDGKNYILKTEKTLKDLSFQSVSAALLIIDISNQDYKDYIGFKGLITDIDIAQIVIIDSTQIELLTEGEIDSSDFILYNQLEEELEARIKIVISKRKIAIPKNSIVINNLILNLDKYELTVNQKTIELTFKEFELFKILLQHQDKVFSRNKLLSAVWDYDFYGGSRTVDVHIRRIRSKIPPPYNLMIKTIRNVGYMFSTQT
jgi:DNA-binding winged helix-turn-helix (wHTH) protein